MIQRYINKLNNIKRINKIIEPFIDQYMYDNYCKKKSQSFWFLINNN